MLKSELLKFSKEELADLILRLMEDIEKLKAHLKKYENSNTPTSQARFNKNTEKRDDQPRFPGREKGHDGAGIKIPKADVVKEHKITERGYKLTGKRTQYVIDFVDKPIIVTKHIIYSYLSPDGKIVEAPNDLPKNVYGKNIQAFSALLKNIGIGHYGIIDIIRSLRSDLSICEATILNLTDEISKRAEKPRNKAIRSLRKESYSQQDETGLRVDGRNGYAWVFCNQRYVIYEFDRSRSGNVPIKILGAHYDKPGVNDGWLGYNFLKKRQRCWPHLLRELDALAIENKEAIPQALHLHELYRKAKAAKSLTKWKRMKKIEEFNSMTELPYIIETLNTRNGCKEFATTLQNAQPHLFTGVEYPEVPLDNNLSERKLKPLIKIRKNAGCIRNEKGERFIENTMTLIQTCRQQNKNVFAVLKKYAG